MYGAKRVLCSGPRITYTRDQARFYAWGQEGIMHGPSKIIKARGSRNNILGTGPRKIIKARGPRDDILGTGVKEKN